MANPTSSGGGVESLRHLTRTSPPSFLSPSLALSLSSRAASQHLFSSLKPFSPKSPFDRLLIDGLDAEQIWQQIDIQSQPLISSLRRQVLSLQKVPPLEISNFFADVEKGQKGFADVANGEVGRSQNVVLSEEEEEDHGDEEEEDDDVEEREGEEREGEGGVEDKFLKIKELEKYMREDERKEFGLVNNKNKKTKNKKGSSEDDEEDDEDDEDDDDLNLLGADMDDDDGEDELGNARYEDFYGSKKKIDQKRKPDLDDDMSEDSDIYGEEHDEKTIDSEEEDEKTFDSEEDDEKTACVKDEFVQKTGLVSAALTFSDEQKKEASMLFKKLCLKLNALSHFHFTPKPVVEDMSIQADVPSLAMEEIAPGVVSDASMLAKEILKRKQSQHKQRRREGELTRKGNINYKAETIRITAFKKARDSTQQKPIDGIEKS